MDYIAEKGILRYSAYYRIVLGILVVAYFGIRGFL